MQGHIEIKGSPSDMGGKENYLEHHLRLERYSYLAQFAIISGTLCSSTVPLLPLAV